MSSCFKKDEINLKPESFGGISSKSSDVVRWPNRNPQLNLAYSDAYEGDFTAIDIDQDNHNPLEQGVKEWNTKTDEDLFVLPMKSVSNKTYNDLNDFYDREMGIYKSFSWYPEVSSTAIAITQFFGKRKKQGTSLEYIEMVHADIIVNYDNYNFSTDKSDGDTYDLESVIVHELGHFIGLDHFNDFGINSVMHPYMSIFEAKRVVQGQDVENFQNLYDQASGRSPLKIHSATSGSTSHSRDSKDHVVRGIIELRADGNCHHYQNGKLIYIH